MRFNKFHGSCLCDNTGNLEFLPSLYVHTMLRAVLRLGSMFLQSYWTSLLSYNSDSGGRMQEIWPSGEIYSAISQERWTLLSNYPCSGEIFVLDNSPGKGCGRRNHPLQPLDLPTDLESLDCAQLA